MEGGDRGAAVEGGDRGGGTRMAASALGLITGLISGLALALGGFYEFLIVLVFGAIGLAVGKVIDGELDLSRYVDRARRRDRR
jgi:uncharacterized membrane protein